MKYVALWMVPALTTALAAVSFGQGDSLSIGPRFHRETAHTESGFVGNNISHGRNLPLYKDYPRKPVTALPKPDLLSKPLAESIAERKSIRSFAGHSLTLAQLSALLTAADGLTHSMGKYELRSAPSGGALFPIEIYVIAAAIDSLKPGIYHFQVADGSLALLSEGDFAGRLESAALDQEFVGAAPVNFILTARFERSTKKYADRGYRYSYIEAGSICQNIYLAATALRLGTVAVGAFINRAVNDIIGIDGAEEAAILIMPVGYPARE
ncbi:MAG: SagB/ThcOx family dehydrogenase [candidate division Zixibacteria bacterium]|nr:SagB/ThcOx family dehydrogenase [candidate division Zixibacteria bacterium]